jgi:hypothetical protein
MTFCFHVSDHRLDGKAPSELAIDAAEDPTFLAGKPLSGFDDGTQRVAIIKIAGQRPDMQHELTTPMSDCLGSSLEAAQRCRLRSTTPIPSNLPQSARRGSFCRYVGRENAGA